MKLVIGVLKMSEEKPKKSLGEHLDSILPPEKVEQFVASTKKMVSGVVQSAKDAMNKKAEKKDASADEKTDKKDTKSDESKDK
tara:strand:- start:4486 stop:4734 length:249 start_codon:yes stop_codon:yes gene_type:complete